MGLVVTISNVSRKSLGLGLTSITNPLSSLIRRLEMVGGSNMMSVVDYLLLFSLIGKTTSMILLYITFVYVLTLFIRVRANIRNGADGFSLANKFFLACLYPTGRGNQQKVEQNFLRSKLLLKVSRKSFFLHLFTCSSLKVFCAIFTSPSSADGFEEETVDGPARKKQRTAGQKKATKSNVASLLNMDGKVSGRSIAYAAVLVRDLNTYIASL
jgi:hypothetical protein